MIWHWFAGLGIGYLIGSVSPAYALGRILKRIDIREVNYRNAGTRNVMKTLGLWPAVVTAVIDTGKGIAAVLIVQSLFGPSYVLVGATIGSVAGHVFPFYLGFRGGRGTATAVGLYIFVAAREIAGGELPWFVMAGMLVIAFIVYLATKSGDATALFAFLAMVFVAIVELGVSVHGLIAAIVSGYAFVHAVFRGRDVGLYELEHDEDFLGWRVLARPFALLFVPLAVVMPRVWFLVLLAVLAGTALALDTVRILKKLRLQRMYRKGESRSLSSISLFLVSVLLVFVLFRTSVASLALVFLAMGDLAGKLTGLRFGRTRIVAGRTLEGSVGFFAGAAVCGYAMAAAIGEPAIQVVIIAAFAAALIELITVGIDDNLTVGLGSAGVITLLMLI